MQHSNREGCGFRASTTRSRRGRTAAFGLASVAAFLALALVLPAAAHAIDPAVDFPDAHLDAAVRVAVHKPAGQLHESDLTSLTTLWAPSQSIQHLDGLEHASNLATLDLNYNEITTVTPLATLTKLTQLWLNGNQVSTIDDVAALTNLRDLELDENAVTTIGPVAGLSELRTLSVTGNNITTLTPVAGLTKLTALYADYNHVPTIDDVAGLTNLTELELHGNEITTIGPVAGLTNLTDLALGENNITTITPVAGLTGLMSLDLSLDPIGHVDDLAALVNLKSLNISAAGITTLSPLAGMTQMRDLTLQSNNITTISVVASMPGLVQLNALNNNISDVTPLLGHSNLTDLYLSRNAIGDADAAPFQSMTSLRTLDIGNNSLTSLSDLAPLTGLQSLYADKNGISDLAPLIGMTHLSQLGLNDNQIYDVSPIAGLPVNSVNLRDNWLDLSPTSPTMDIIDGWKLHGVTVWYDPQRPGGALVGTATAPGRGGLASVRIELLQGQYCDSRPGGSYRVCSIKPGVRSVTFTLPYYTSVTTTFAASAGATTTLDVMMQPVQLAPTIIRAPNASSLTYKRKRGKAKFTLAARLTDARGAVPGAWVWLQKNMGGTKWKTLYKLRTSSAGKVSKAFSVRKKGTMYYRWYSPATAYDATQATGRQKVRVK